MYSFFLSGPVYVTTKHWFSSPSFQLFALHLCSSETDKKKDFAQSDACPCSLSSLHPSPSSPKKTINPCHFVRTAVLIKKLLVCICFPSPPLPSPPPHKHRITLRTLYSSSLKGETNLCPAFWGWSDVIYTWEVGILCQL